MSKASGRAQTRFVCQSCGESFLRWEGQCRACSAWNSLVETQVRSGLVIRMAVLYDVLTGGPVGVRALAAAEVA